MLEKSFESLYLLFRANYYKKMVEKIGTRQGSLSATESYCVEIIHLLDKPTISEFAQYLNISVPNATYKINSLVKKNYVIKQPSEQDRRECRLIVTDKFLGYYGLKDRDHMRLMRQIRRNFSKDEIHQLDDMIQRILVMMQEENDA